MQKLKILLEPPRQNFENIFSNIQNINYFKQYEDSIITNDNIKLPFILFLHPKPRATIVYNHSYGSCKQEGSYLIPLCYNYKLNLCLYDSRASGKSSGGKITFGYKEKEDLFILLNNLKIEKKCKKIILWGRSIGCNTVLQLIQKLQQEVRFQTFGIENQSQLPHIVFTDIIGIILDSPYTSFYELFEDNLKKHSPILFKLFSKPLFLFARKWIEYEIGINIQENQNIELLSQCSTSICIIYSKKDELIPVERFLQLQKEIGKNLYKDFYLFIEMNKKHAGSRKEIDLVQGIQFLMKQLKQTNPSLFQTSIQRERIEKKQKIEKQKTIENLKEIENVDINEILFKNIFQRTTYKFKTYDKLKELKKQKENEKQQGKIFMTMVKKNNKMKNLSEVRKLNQQILKYNQDKLLIKYFQFKNKQINNVKKNYQIQKYLISLKQQQIGIIKVLQ